MHSSSADWVFGDARLISSAITMLAKTGPGRNSNSVHCRLKIDKPVMSTGIRSGVNCTRLTEPSIERARALASDVLPTPGTSSRSRCPSANSVTSATRITSGLPTITRCDVGGDPGTDVGDIRLAQGAPSMRLLVVVTTPVSQTTRARIVRSSGPSPTFPHRSARNGVAAPS